MEAEVTVVSPDPCSKAKDGRKVSSHGKEEAGERMSDDAELGLFLLSLVFAALAAWALCHAGGDPPVTVMWRLALFVCGCLAFWIGALAGAGARAVLFRVPYAALGAFAVGNRVSVVAMCVAGFFGYYLAVYTHSMNKTSR